MPKSKELPTYVDRSKGSTQLADTTLVPSHEIVDKGDPRVNGPFLDDVRAEQEDTYRKNRVKNLRATSKKATSSKSKKTKAQQEKAQDALVEAREKVIAEQNRETDNTLRPVVGGEQRANKEVEMSTDVHPTQRPLSNPSDENPEDNLPVPKTEDAKVSPKLVAESLKSLDPPKKKKPAKKAAAKKATAKKATAKKQPAKKTAAKKKSK